MTREHLDVVIVGAGLSGIGAAYHLQTALPGKSVAILEARDAIGGTWDLFRYPGVRSDSDMYTLGYAFRPWPDSRTIADGASILRYIEETAATYGIDRTIRFGHAVRSAAWSSGDARWTLQVDCGDAAPVEISCGFLFACTGYYDYEAGYQPAFLGVERYKGRLIHPQAWPENLDYAGKRVVVVGSGATAVTLVPALADGGAMVTMLQRSPSYVVSRPARDRLADRLRGLLPARLAYQLVRWRNVLLTLAFYRYARQRPEGAKRRLLSMARDELGPDFDIATHFTPRYDPWDQRLCLVPDSDLFRVLKSGAAEIFTDEIETFTETGLRLRSGRRLDADIVVTATGLKLKLLGGIPISVDGRQIDLSKTMSYKGSMFSGVPNLAYALGYTNASWTLKCDLTSVFVCRLLRYMDRRGYAACRPQAEPDVAPQPLIDFTSGYIQRAIDKFPHQGDRKPWRLHQNYLLDLMALKYGPLDDRAMQFTSRRDPARAA